MSNFVNMNWDVELKRRGYPYAVLLAGNECDLQYEVNQLNQRGYTMAFAYGVVEGEPGSYTTNFVWMVRK